MDKLKKYNIIYYVIGAVYFAFIVVCLILIKQEVVQEKVLFIPLGILTAICIPIIGWLESKIKKLRKIKQEENLLKEKEENKKKLFERSQLNSIVNTMYELYNGSSEELNQLLEKHALAMDYFYDDEENEDYFVIEPKSYIDVKQDEIYIFDLSGKGIIELEKGETLDYSSKSYKEIEEVIINDINKFFSEEE